MVHKIFLEILFRLGHILKKAGNRHIMSITPSSSCQTKSFEDVFDVAKMYFDNQSILNLCQVSRRISNLIYLNINLFKLKNTAIKDKTLSLLIILVGKTNFQEALKKTYQIFDIKIRDATLIKIAHLAVEENYPPASIIDQIQNNELRANTLLEIALIQAKKNPKGAFELVNEKKVENEVFKCSLFGKIAVIQAHFDPTEATQQAQRIPLIDIQKKILWKIA